MNKNLLFFFIVWITLVTFDRPASSCTCIDQQRGDASYNSITFETTNTICSSFGGQGSAYIITLEQQVTGSGTCSINGVTYNNCTYSFKKIHPYSCTASSLRSRKCK